MQDHMVDLSVPECSICMDSYSETLLCRTPCAHKICVNCILLMKEFNCPICRAQLPRSKTLMKARKLFNNEPSTKKEVISIYNSDEFPPL